MEEVNMIKYKVFLCVIILFTIVENMLKYNFVVVGKYLGEMINHKGKGNSYLLEKLNEFLKEEKLKENDLCIEFGLTVINELYLISNFYIDNYIVTHKYIAEYLKSEINKSLLNFISIIKFTLNYKAPETAEEFNAFFDLRITRLNAVILVLCGIGFSNENFSETEVHNFIALGKWAQIFITLNRDYYKKSRKVENSFNVFKEYYFNKSKKLGRKISEDEIKQAYFSLKGQDMEKLSKQISQIYIKDQNISGALLMKKVRLKIEKYYQITNEMMPKI